MLSIKLSSNGLADFLGDARPTVLVTDEARMDALTPVAQAAGVDHVVSLESGGAHAIHAAAGTDRRGTARWK